MIDLNDYIIKDYYSKTGKHKPQRWVMHYCDKCGVKRGYAPRNKKAKLCQSCACKGRTISAEQRKAISKSLIGNTNHKGHTAESRVRAISKSLATKRNLPIEIKLQRRDAMGAAKLGISVEEYLIIKSDIQIKRKIAHNIRSQIGHLMRGVIGKIRHIDWTVHELKTHLESKFLPGMSWENYGRKKGIRCWEIDHIIPIRSKNINGEYIWKRLDDPDSDDFKKLWSLENLQPLWADENNKKNNNIA
jgi:hypothetical protein